MANPRPLDGRLAVVTGGARGIGAAIADRLSDLGAELVLMGRDEDALRARVAALEGRGVRVAAVPCDVADEGSVGAAFARVREIGAPNVLVNNAGQSVGASFAETTRTVWDRMLAVNLTGTYLCTREVLSGMEARGWGRVINVASTAGLKGYSHVSAYCAAKHGVVGLTRALAAETAGRGVTVNAICPGYVDTEMGRSAVDNLMAAGRTEAEARKAITRPMRLGRLIRPEEVAATAAWLCSNDAAAVTGQAIAVAGTEVMVG